MQRCEKRGGLNTDALHSAHKKFNPAKSTFLISLLNYQAVSSYHKNTVEPLVDHIYGANLNGCIFSRIVLTMKAMKTTCW